MNPKTTHKPSLHMLFFAAACLLCPSQPAAAREKQVVTISYTLAPPQPLPPHIKAVAVIDAGVDSDEERADAREKKWANFAADMLEAMIQASPQPTDRRLTIVQRRATRQILAEKDLQLAGIVEADLAARAGQLLAVQALIASKIDIHIDTRKVSRTQIDWTGMLGVRRPGVVAGPRGRVAPAGPPQFPVRQVEAVSRTLSVQCSFSLIDVATGESLLKFNTPVIQKQDKKSPDWIFGRRIQEAELDPVDHFIGELVERAATEFVSLIVPTQVRYSYEIVGKGKHGEKGVLAIRADDYELARREFEAAHADDPERDVTVFALGVTCELLGDPRRALQYYRQAAGMEDVDEDDLAIYLAAKTRLASHIDRIVPSALSPRSQEPGAAP